MSTDHTELYQKIEENSVSTGRQRAIVWSYFEKITGDDGLPKTRCIKCNTVYSAAPNSGTSTMRRHLHKCCPQPLTQLSPTHVSPGINSDRSSDEAPNEDRPVKKLKSVMEENLQTKTDRELVEFIWMNKRNIGLLEEKLPDKAVPIKEALKCYEDEIDRRAKLQRLKENSRGPGTSMKAVKIEGDDQHVARYENVGENIAEDGSVAEGRTAETHSHVNKKTSPHFDNGKVVIKVEVGDPSVAENENFDGNIVEEERAGRLQIVAIHRDENQTSAQQTTISVLPGNIWCAELKKVSSTLSMLTSPNSFYTPQHNPLDQEAEQAKQTLINLLKKDFKSIVGSPDEQSIKSCIQILIKNLDKLPMIQGKVIKSLHTEFESACQNWINWHTIVQTNNEFEVQQGGNLEVLQKWQKKDMELESRIAKMDEDIDRLKAELREKEMRREGLVKQKMSLFDESKISIDEAKKLLKEMVSVKLQSDVAIDNIKDVASNWEGIREKFRL